MKKTADILLVEDSEADAFLTREALNESGIDLRLHRVPDGSEALQFVRKEGKYANAPVPTLVLLDLNLPKITGHEVLAQLKSDPTLRSIPVVVMSTSEREEDVALAYEQYANCYVIKPVDLDRFFSRVQSLARFWLEDATLTHG